MRRHRQGFPGKGEGEILHALGSPNGLCRRQFPGVPPLRAGVGTIHRRHLVRRFVELVGVLESITGIPIGTARWPRRRQKDLFASIVHLEIRNADTRSLLALRR